MRERRYAVTRFKVRAAGDDGASGVIEGHAAVFNTRSDYLYDWLGGFVEQVAPTAFDQALTHSDVRALFNHDVNLILGRNTAGTLRVETDNIGLAYEIDPPDTQAGRDTVTSIKRGDISQSSFSFDVLEEQWGLTDEGIPLRTLVVIDPLYDVSPVTFPAYPAADVGLRAALASLAEQRSMSVDDAMAMARAGDLRKLIPTGRANRPTDAELRTAEINAAKHHRPAIPA